MGERHAMLCVRTLLSKQLVDAAVHGHVPLPLLTAFHRYAQFVFLSSIIILLCMVTDCNHQHVVMLSHHNILPRFTALMHARSVQLTHFFTHFIQSCPHGSNPLCNGQAVGKLIVRLHWLGTAHAYCTSIVGYLQDIGKEAAGYTMPSAKQVMAQLPGFAVKDRAAASRVLTDLLDR